MAPTYLIQDHVHAGPNDRADRGILVAEIDAESHRAERDASASALGVQLRGAAAVPMTRAKRADDDTRQLTISKLRRLR
jgi:hypothetical protein